ncbi:MAG: MBL fold metallo-hydrolase [Bacillota bacterium]|nr:MBL fold metallo-hydrolase [Bacillota bacterium]
MSYKILDLKFDQNGVRFTINPVVIYDDQEMVLVDCGHPDALPKLVQAESIYDSLPEDQKESAKRFAAYLESIEHTKVDILLNDGDRFDCCGSFEIIATPGHMPGHISIYLPESKTLISGDALVVQKGELEIANPQYSLDIEGTRASALKLSKLEIDRVICYHGGLYTGEVHSALIKMASVES